VNANVYVWGPNNQKKLNFLTVEDSLSARGPPEADRVFQIYNEETR
jgi:hypothetical protein